MKKFLLVLLIFLMTQNCCLASKMRVIALNDFSTVDKDADVKAYVFEDFYLQNKVLIPKGTIIAGKIRDVKNPARLKRNADFNLEVQYIMDPAKRKYKLKDEVLGNYGKPFYVDKNELTESAVVTVANWTIPGFSFVYRGLQGAKQNRGRRIRGAAQNIYKHSFLSYVEKGGELYIKNGDPFVLAFPDHSKNKYRMPEDAFIEIDNYGNPVAEYNIDGTVRKKLPQESELQPNYPYKHQVKNRVRYLYRPKN